MQEISSLVLEITRSIKALVQTFLDIEANDTRASSGQAGDEYMVRTGTVHDLLDKARGPDGLSNDNVAAVRKKWAEDGDLLADVLREVGEMIENAESVDDADEEELEGGDEWDELGLGSNNRKLDAAEVGRTRQVDSAMHLSRSLININ